MRCKVCGKENRDNAKFCYSCGSNLEIFDEDTQKYNPIEDEYENKDYDTKESRPYSRENYEALRKDYRKPKSYNDYNDYDDYDDYRERRPYKKKTSPFKKFLLLVLSLLLIAGAGFGCYYFYKNQKMASLEKYAMEAMVSGDYEDAAEYYEDLYKLNSSSKTKDLMDEATNLAFDAKKLEKVDSLILSGSYKEAYENIEDVKKHNNKLLEEASKKEDVLMANIEEKLVDNVKDGNFTKSLNIVNDLLKIGPENDKLNELKDKILNNQTKSEEEKKKAEEEAEKEAKEKENKEKEEKLSGEGDRLINTYQYVTSKIANVRSGPGLSYPVQYVLNYGDEVYVIDTKHDSVRTWCNIGYGWISYRTLDGSGL
ncbi:SH3 domain-containing protein [uncultured Peptoniphilus sp.]|uniref:SH3 domain-containing protein n=1 Tax=uncultured Peptoniphilus sp. TaxID=254354 RepID=UPI0028054165|nr:SH3 domain-containing protein [uncultured Peptoniphilus sp.]